MNLMFLNSMEKATEEGRVRTAQVSICENQGSWVVMWNEIKEDGHSEQETWYEGLQWDEMLSSFRERVFMKQCDGFHPMLEMSVSEVDGLDGRAAFIQMLHFYSEKHSNEELYEALRQWRWKQASREGKAQFIIATNRLLKMISTFVPQTEEELLQLPGFGRTKSTMYSAEILALTVQSSQSGTFPLTWVEGKIDPLEFNAWLLEEKERKRKAEADKQEIKRKLLEAISRGEQLDQLIEQTRVQRRNLLLWIEELDRDGYDLESYIELMLEPIPAEERELAWKAFEQQGDRYLKPILQTVYKQEELSAKEADRIYEWLRLLRMKFRRANAMKAVEAF
ncbi:hypothetical protein ACVLD2_002743 [Paenibacillus sp. PvR052]|nr:hypothetical protein [Paenibacillus sp. PvP091]MBP1172485.1 hypothetical protein [Paenibacillus sp. PvR098]MBP2438866.1 hypothetical protein [Paenibacillus sp. PvP052]